MRLSEETLRRLYHAERMSARQIAASFGTTHTAVLKRMKRMGIDRRSRRGALLDIEFEKLHHMYVTCGLSEREIGTWFDIESYVVKREMGRLGIPRREIEYPTGPQNHAWRGDDCTYGGFHTRVRNLPGRPSECEYCGTSDPDACYDWANLTGNYADIFDYVRLCRRCHKRQHAGHISVDDLIAISRAGSVATESF